LPINQGEFLGAGSRAFVLADVSSLEAKFKLPPDQADSLTLGSSSELKLIYKGISFPAKLERRTTIPGADRQVQLSAVSSSADIPVGATATLSYQLRIAKGMILPSSAVRLVAGVSTVFLVQGGKAVPQAVKILGEAEGKMALEGLPKYVSVVYPLPNEITGFERLEVIK
jgi:HlyD family secretion protein